MKVKGGEKASAALHALAAALGTKAVLRVGFLENATYPDGRGTSVAMVAAIQNYGAPARNIPPRPFFSNMVHDDSPGWAKLMAQALKKYDYDVPQAMDAVGEVLGGQLRQAINDFEGAPLAAATVARKGFDKQLIDSSYMVNNVDHEVQTGAG